MLDNIPKGYGTDAKVEVTDVDFIATTGTCQYNTRDQATLMQDGNLAVQTKYLATLFDDYGRPTKTGYWTGTPPSTISPTTLTITTANELTKNFYDGNDGATQLSLTTYPQYRGKVRKSMVKTLDAAGTWLYATNTYDVHGRLTATVGNNYQYATFDTAESNTFTYDWADNPLGQTRVHRPSSSVTRTLTYRNTHDAAGRSSGYFLKIDSGTEQKLANYSYDERDYLVKRNLGATGSTYLQSLDYTYNAQGWLVNINGYNLGGGSMGIKTAPTLPVAPSPTTGSTVETNDLFYLALKYDQLEPSFPATSRKDGNIAQVVWRTRGRERQAYAADYDYLGRMTTAAYYDLTDANAPSSDQKFREEVTYKDARGNIQTLKRNGMYPSGSAWAVGQIDNMTYTTTSGTNKLASVSDAAPTAGKNFGFKPGTGSYAYDANGNLTTDPYKGITTGITYNHLNLPTTIPFSGGKSISFVYDATGRKLKKTTSGGTTAENYTQYYADGLEYRGTTLEAIYHEEGRITPKTGGGWQYEYSIRDHLGNTRLTFADKNGNGIIEVTNTSSNEILQENHYTPFGLELGYAWMSGSASPTKYRFGGKEVQEDFGLKWNDHGARFYDPAIGRWTSVDPLADSYASISPYTYVANNPILLIDPDGMSITNGPYGGTLYTGQDAQRVARQLQSQGGGDKEPDGEYYDTKGNHLGSDGVDDGRIYLQNQSPNTGGLSTASGMTGINQILLSLQRLSHFREVDGLILIDRQAEGSDNTIGSVNLIGHNGNNMYSLEPEGPATTTPNQDRRIPDGIYNTDSYSSVKYPDNWILSNSQVSTDRRILIHAGNNGRNTEGCVMMGCIVNTNSIGASREALSDLRVFMTNKSIVKTIIKTSIQ